MTRARPRVLHLEPQQEDAEDAAMLKDRLPWRIALLVQLSLALWAWVCLAGAATLLARVIGGA